MKRLIPLAILSITMALPAFLTSCSSDDELLPDTPEVLKPTITNWIEPWHYRMPLILSALIFRFSWLTMLQRRLRKLPCLHWQERRTMHCQRCLRQISKKARQTFQHRCSKCIRSVSMTTLKRIHQL